MAITERHIRNIFIYTLPRIANYAINLVTLPILTRLLTPEDFGTVVLVWIFPTIAANVLTLGLVSAGRRYYFEYKKDKDMLETHFFSLQAYLYICLLISLLGVFFLKDIISHMIIKSDKYGWAIFLTFITAYLAQIINFYLSIYQNMEKARAHSFFNIVRFIITAAATLLFAWYFMSYMGIIYGSLTGTAVVCLLMFLHFNRGAKPLFNINILISNIKYGIQVLPKAFSGLLMTFFDKYMIHNILSLSAVGIYSIGQSIGNTIFLFTGSIWSSFQPVFYKEIFDKENNGSASAGRLCNVFIYITLLPILLMIIFTEELVHLIAPSSYYKAIDIIIIILGSVAIRTFSKLSSAQFAYTKKPYLLFPITLVGTAVNIAANIFLIPRFGIMGAGCSVVITYFVLNSIFTFIGQRLYRVQYEWKKILFLYTIIAVALMSVLYMRSVGYGLVPTYGVKLVLISLFFLAGIRTKLITTNSVQMVLRAICNKTKLQEG